MRSCSDSVLPLFLSREELLNETSAPRAAALLVLHEDTPDGLALARSASVRFGSGELVVQLHALSELAQDSDRRARVELDQALEGLARRPGVERERLAVLGFGRGGTLAFLLGCTRRLAAVVDVDGPVLHPALSAERPIQPLELGLNLEGAFLGVFARGGAVGAQELALLGERLGAAARPFELLEYEGAEGLRDPARLGYDARRAEELWGRMHAFLREHLAAEPG